MVGIVRPLWGRRFVAWNQATNLWTPLESKNLNHLNTMANSDSQIYIQVVFAVKNRESLIMSNNLNPICPNRRKNRSTQNPIPTKLAGVGEFIWQLKQKGV